MPSFQFQDHFGVEGFSFIEVLLQQALQQKNCFGIMALATRYHLNIDCCCTWISWGVGRGVLDDWSHVLHVHAWTAIGNFIGGTFDVTVSLCTWWSAMLSVQSLIRCNCKAAIFFYPTPQRGAADTEIKVPFDKNTDLRGSPFEAWSRSVYCPACFTYCQGFLPC